MTTKEFEALCVRVIQEGTETDRRVLVDHAIDLRLLAVECIDRADTWDQDWPQLGYQAYGDPNRGVISDETRAWAKAHGYSRWG